MHSRLLVILLITLFFYPKEELKADASVADNDQLLTKLKTRQPNNILEILDTFPDGSPMTVLLLEPKSGSSDCSPVKLLTYNIEGDLHNETDVVPLEGENGAFELHGPSVTYYSYNRVEQICFYCHGELYGTVKTYYPNGQLQSVVEVRDNRYHGLLEKFYENGDLAESVHYAEGKRSGTKLCYYQGQKKASSEQYKNDLLHGERVEWYPDGKQKGLFLYHNGLLNGTYSNVASTLFHPNGLILEEQDFRQGQRFGPRNVFLSNGEKDPAEPVPAKEGISLPDDGEYLERHPNGQIYRKYLYKDAMFDGLNQEFYATGQLKLRVLYKDKKKHGSYEEWFEDGRQAVSILFDNGLKSGMSTTWHPNGQKASSGMFRKGNPEGLFQEWFENGSLSSERNFIITKEGSCLDGDVSIWHPDGTLAEISHFSAGVPVKEHLIYYPRQEGCQDNQLSRSMHYSNGKPDGECSSFYPNGMTHALINYRSGVLHGKKALWDQNGTLIEEAHYVDGLLEGSSFLRKGDGKEVVSHYKNNRLHGDMQVFYPRQESLEKVIALQATYVDGLAEGDMVEFSPKGSKQSVTPYKKGEKEGVMLLFSDRGKVAVSVEFHKDKLNGMAYEYHPNGQLKKQVLFADNQKENEEKAFYSNGQPASLTNYSKGLINGITKQWNKEGVLIFEADYVQGKRHGRFNKYDQNGDPIVLQLYEDDKLIQKESKQSSQGVSP